MDTLIENRERASRKRERYCKRLNKTIVLNKNDQDATITPIRESLTKLDSTIAYLNSEIASCQQVLMTYDEEQQSNELIQGPDPQFIVICQPPVYRPKKYSTSNRICYDSEHPWIIVTIDNIHSHVGYMIYPKKVIILGKNPSGPRILNSDPSLSD